MNTYNVCSVVFARLAGGGSSSNNFFGAKRKIMACRPFMQLVGVAVLALVVWVVIMVEAIEGDVLSAVSMGLAFLIGGVAGWKFHWLRMQCLRKRGAYHAEQARDIYYQMEQY